MKRMSATAVGVFIGLELWHWFDDAVNEIEAESSSWKSSNEHTS